MASLLDNKAAWIVEPLAKPLKVGPGPDQSTPAEDEVVIKVAYAAINPSEWKFQDFAYLPLKYPHVLGSDVAGEVIKVGSGVTRFKAGDHVIGHCLGLVHGGAKHGGFQNYTTCLEGMTAKITTEIVPLVNAVVLPISISTAAVGLFEILALDIPSLNAEAKEETVVVWGGSSSCGSTAIQLAVASGYTVITTASAHNLDYVKNLGATYAFDHSDPDVVQNIIDSIKKKFAGALDCIGEEKTQRACANIIDHFGGGVLPIVLWPANNLPNSVTPTLINATNPGLTNKKLGQAIWGDFVPKALESGKLVAKPDPAVIEGGLERIQEAMEVQKKGVSARKVVVEM